MSGTVPKTPSLNPSDLREARRAAWRPTLWYAAVALAWILLSDQALGFLHVGLGLTVLLSQLKGFLFVVVTSAILFLASYDALRTIQTSSRRYQELFANATEGLTLYRVVRDDEGAPVDLIVEDVNEARSAMSHVRREQLIGKNVEATAQLDTEINRFVALIWEAVREGTSCGAEIHDESRDTYRLATVYPIDADLWALALVDVTDERRVQKALWHQEEAIRQAYMDVLDAVTGGKLVLLTEHDLAAELGEPAGREGTIDSPEQLSPVRQGIRGEIEHRFPGSTAARGLVNPVGEALNNVLAHAGCGTYQVFAKPDGTVQVAVSDSGPGIDFRNLPNATLVEGYSSTATLGMGFTIMLKLTDRVLLTTRPGRTVIVLECRAAA